MPNSIFDKDSPTPSNRKNLIEETLRKIQAEKEAWKLLAAVSNNKIKAAEAILAKGVDVNGIEGESTPLSVAVKNNNIKMAEFLLQKGARVHGSEEDKDLPLITAITLGSSELVKLLLSYGADVNYGHDGTPLFIAMLSKYHKYYENHTAPILRDDHLNLNIIKLLLSAGADIKANDLLDECCRLGGVSQVKLLLKAGVLDIHENALYIAAKYDRLEIVKLLLLEDANPNIGWPMGWTDEYTSLDIALLRSCIKVAQELLKAGAICKSVSNSKNPQITSLLKIKEITEKVAQGILLKPIETSIIADVTLSDDMKATFIERAGKLLAIKASNETYINFDTYSYLPYIAQIKHSFYVQFTILAANEIIAGKDLKESAIAHLLEIKTKPEYKEYHEEFIANLCEKAAKNYKKIGYTISATKYSDILGAEDLKAINESKEIQNINAEVLAYYVDIICNLFDYKHVPPADMLEEGINTLEKYKKLRSQLEDHYKAKIEKFENLLEEANNEKLTKAINKLELTNKIFALIEGAIGNTLMALTDKIIDIELFLGEQRSKVFDERKANIYRSLYEMVDKGILPCTEMKGLIKGYFCNFFRAYDIPLEAPVRLEETVDHAAIDTPPAGGAGVPAYQEDIEVTTAEARPVVGETIFDEVCG